MRPEESHGTLLCCVLLTAAEKDWTKHKPICAFIAKIFENLPMQRKKIVEEELLKTFPVADSAKIEYLTEVQSKALKIEG